MLTDDVLFYLWDIVELKKEGHKQALQLLKQSHDKVREEIRRELHLFNTT